LDNIFTERLWRTVKEVYLTRQGLTRYLQLYNQEHVHQALGY
jgi:transposase InsO family protein